MRMPTKSMGYLTFVDLGIGLAALLEADGRVSQLAPRVRDATQRVEDAATVREKARRAKVLALAFRAKSDSDADTVVRTLDSDAFAQSGRNRTRSPYRDLFDKGVSPVVQAPLPREIAAIKSLEDVVATIPKLAAHGPALQAARATLERTCKEFDESLRKFRDAHRVVTMAKQDWTAEIRSVYGLVLAAVGGDKKLAESFFAAFAAPAEKPEEDSDEVDGGDEVEAVEANPADDLLEGDGA